MPCYDIRSSPSYYEDQSDRKRIEIEGRNVIIKSLEHEKEWLSAALCAILNEVERKYDINYILAEASRNGLIGLVGWWESHKKDDESRLAKSLHSLSKDEQSMLKKILNERKDI